VNVRSVDASVVSWILEACLERGVWSEIKILNQCRFVFSAGLTSVAGGGGMRPTRLEVRGGRCGRWPERALSEKGDGVQCLRSGASAVSVALQTDRGGAVEESLPALSSESIPSEPVREMKLSAPISEVVELSRSRDFHLHHLGQGCPACALYYAELRPTAPDATILWAGTVSSSGAGWQRCPAGLRCGVYEFTPPDDLRVSGCAGTSQCRVWRLAETSGEASDVVQLTYQQLESVCANCPEGMDFDTAHATWRQHVAQSAGRCETFADLPAQLLGPGHTR
jgi:hypothetical protein